MPRRLALLAVVLAMVSASAVVATTASAAGTGSITGVVTGPGGVPLEGAGAGVYLQPGNNIEVGWAAGTDATGAYAIPNLPAGDYKVLFGYPTSTSPFAHEWYDDALDEASADLVHVADGTAVTGIDAELAVGARVSGRLTTPTGVRCPTEWVWANRLADGHDPSYTASASPMPTASTSSRGYRPAPTG